MNPERPNKKQSKEYKPSYGANGNEFGFIENEINIRPMGRMSFLIKKIHTNSLLKLKFFLVLLMLLFCCFLFFVYLSVFACLFVFKFHVNGIVFILLYIFLSVFKYGWSSNEAC